jgi:hypothetical protein
MVTLQITLVMGYLFPYFGDTTERGDKGGGESRRDGGVKQRVTLWITRLCKYILQSLWKPSKPCEEERKVVGEGHTGE